MNGAMRFAYCALRAGESDLRILDYWSSSTLPSSALH